VFSFVVTWQCVKSSRQTLVYPCIPLSRWRRLSQRFPLACRTAIRFSVVVYLLVIILTSLLHVWKMVTLDPSSQLNSCETPLAYLTRVRGFGIALFVTTLHAALTIDYAHHVCEVIDTEPISFDFSSSSSPSSSTSSLMIDSSSLALFLTALTHSNPLVKVCFFFCPYVFIFYFSCKNHTYTYTKTINTLNTHIDRMKYPYHTTHTHLTLNGTVPRIL
jgi:hypothetical protein